MNIEKILKDFCGTDGVSGDEKGIAEKACKTLEKYCRDMRYYKGNVIAEFGSEKEKATNILIDTHMDQVGLQVTAITEKGFISLFQLFFAQFARYSSVAYAAFAPSAAAVTI